MPLKQIIKNSSQFSSYKSPAWLYNGHLQTIIPSIFRKVENVPYKRERIKTIDKDFLDIDWLLADSSNLVIISHGLEGDSQRAYIKGMARAFHLTGWDVLAWNFRGCSGEMNKLLRFYHSGDTHDLEFVINYALAKKKYHKIFLIGFSLGGNITLKFLGEKGENLQKEIIGAATFSVPLDLHTSCIKISKKSNFIYSKRFLRHLKRKVSAKSKKMPDLLTTEHFNKIKTLTDFDDLYTAPIHGFKDAVTYYKDSSALPLLNSIAVPTLIVNAKNDPFLSSECYPENFIEGEEYVLLEVPLEGGHCGFPEYNKEGLFWSEKRALAFAASLKKET